MNIVLKMTQRLRLRALRDLRRPHAFAFERVGFVTCRFGRLLDGGIIILAHDYHQVADDDYIDDCRFGALISSNAFRNAFQLAFRFSVGLLHVHLHDQSGNPVPSPIDFAETLSFVPDFFNVRPTLPHGAVIFGADGMSGRVWLAKETPPESIKAFHLVGEPLCRIDAR